MTAHGVADEPTPAAVDAATDPVTPYLLLQLRHMERPVTTSSQQLPERLEFSAARR